MCTGDSIVLSSIACMLTCLVVCWLCLCYPGGHVVCGAQVLLPGYSGTWAECVSQLLVSLLRACQLEAVRLSGFWKAGGWVGSVGPGEKLASHNHAW